MPTIRGFGIPGAAIPYTRCQALSPAYKSVRFKKGCRHGSKVYYLRHKHL